MPSIVTIGTSTATAASTRHAHTSSPSTSTLHEPHSPCFARPLGAVQAESLAQDVEQALAEPGVGDIVVDAVDPQPVVLTHRGDDLGPVDGERPAQQAPGEDVDRVAAVCRRRPVVVDRAARLRRQAAELGHRVGPDRTTPPSRSRRRRMLRRPMPARSSGRPSRGRCAPTGTARRPRGTPRRWRSPWRCARRPWCSPASHRATAR